MFARAPWRESRRVPELAPNIRPAHLQAMLRTARALADTPEEADDLVQETLVKVLARPREIAAGPAAGPYLLQALRNTHVSSLRARDRRPRTAPLEPEDARLVASAALEPAAVVASREVIGAIAALPADQRDVVAAVDVVGLPYREAAARLRIPVGTVMSRLHRGRARLVAVAA
jgi:RNA polymerase sigma-70 factor (ECF subfamily)